MSTALPPPAMSPFVLPDTKHVVFPLAALSALSAVVASALRRLRLKSSMIALLALLTLTAFCVLHQHLNDAPRLSFTRALPSRASNDRVRHRFYVSTRPSHPKITLAPDEELSSVIAFMAALHSNALPDSVNPLVPVDPDLVLDFDTRTSKAAAEVHHLVEDTWSRLPVVLLSKRHSPISREIKTYLAEYNLKPSPTVFEVDERADEAVLTPLLCRLTAATDLPILLIGGKPVGSIDTIRNFNTTGRLRTMISASGAVIDGGKQDKKRKRRLPG